LYYYCFLTIAVSILLNINFIADEKGSHKSGASYNFCSKSFHDGKNSTDFIKIIIRNVAIKKNGFAYKYAKKRFQ